MKIDIRITNKNIGCRIKETTKNLTEEECLLFIEDLEYYLNERIAKLNE